jgi:hypothetical protein
MYLAREKLADSSKVARKSLRRESVAILTPLAWLARSGAP